MKPSTPTDSEYAVATPFSVKLVSGAIGGFIGTAVIFPLDLAKTRLQNQTAESPIQYRGIWHCLRSSIATDGFSGAYRGLIPNLVGVMPEKALKLACNAQFREILADSNGKVSLLNEVLAGALTGLVQCSITSPMEIVKIRSQMASKGASSVQVIRDLGLRGMYKGSAATLLRDIPFSVLFFTINCKSKEKFADEEGNLAVSSTLALGTVAGIISAVAVTPCDVIKTRLQSKATVGHAQYSGVFDAFQTVLRKEGVSALFKGASARGMVVGPLFGMAVLSYDICERFFHKYLK